MYTAASFREACECQNVSHKGAFYISTLIKATLLELVVWLVGCFGSVNQIRIPLKISFFSDYMTKIQN